MKLNPDCIRDILLDAEKVIDFHTFYFYEKDQGSALSQNYSHEETIYHIRQAKQSGLISISPFYDSGDSVCITDITPAGHEFLANIRKDTIWQKTKDTAAKIGSSSLSVLCQIASSVVSEIVKSQFNDH